MAKMLRAPDSDCYPGLDPGSNTRQALCKLTNTYPTLRERASDSLHNLTRSGVAQTDFIQIFLTQRAAEMDFASASLIRK
jgi:hypothetical protein